MGISQVVDIGCKAISRTLGIATIYPRVIKVEDLKKDHWGQLVSIMELALTAKMIITTPKLRVKCGQ